MFTSGQHGVGYYQDHVDPQASHPRQARASSTERDVTSAALSSDSSSNINSSNALAAGSLDPLLAQVSPADGQQQGNCEESSSSGNRQSLGDSGPANGKHFSNHSNSLNSNEGRAAASPEYKPFSEDLPTSSSLEPCTSEGAGSVSAHPANDQNSERPHEGLEPADKQQVSDGVHARDHARDQSTDSCCGEPALGHTSPQQHAGQQAAASPSSSSIPNHGIKEVKLPVRRPGGTGTGD